jgi:hypothetical protein
MDQLGSGAGEFLPDLLALLTRSVRCADPVIMRYSLSMSITILQVLPWLMYSPPLKILEIIDFCLVERDFQVMSDPALLASLASVFAVGQAGIPESLIDEFVSMSTAAGRKLLDWDGVHDLQDIDFRYDSIFEALAAVICVSQNVSEFWTQHQDLLIQLVDQFRTSHRPPVPAHCLQAYCQLLKSAVAALSNEVARTLAHPVVLAWCLVSDVDQVYRTGCAFWIELFTPETTSPATLDHPLDLVA